MPDNFTLSKKSHIKVTKQFSGKVFTYFCGKFSRIWKDLIFTLRVSSDPEVERVNVNPYALTQVKNFVRWFQLRNFRYSSQRGVWNLIQKSLVFIWIENVIQFSLSLLKNCLLANMHIFKKVKENRFDFLFSSTQLYSNALDGNFVNNPLCVKFLLILWPSSLNSTCGPHKFTAPNMFEGSYYLGRESKVNYSYA